VRLLKRVPLRLLQRVDHVGIDVDHQKVFHGALLAIGSTAATVVVRAFLDVIAPPSRESRYARRSILTL
jgi:hypothetical protein